MAVYYNEIDRFAASWLRNLIKSGHIADGDVDERSIVDVNPADLRKYTQCHFFAGIGVWSHALRRAGWPNDANVWTGSCPCQPFSAAGKGGGFADERHLWPHFHYLIEQCRPTVVLGEQVASKDGLAWFDLVQSDLEGSGYAAGAVDSCSAGFGAPHIRQRLYWMAYAGRPCGERRTDAEGFAEFDARERRQSAVHNQPRSSVGILADADDARLEGRGGVSERADQCAPGSLGVAGVVGNPADQSRERDAGSILAAQAECERQGQFDGSGAVGPEYAGAGVASWPRPTNGFWQDADWLLCRDGKWRPVEPGTFPLAHGAAARVGRLRAYGNAINAEQATAFCEVVREIL